MECWEASRHSAHSSFRMFTANPWKLVCRTRAWTFYTALRQRIAGAWRRGGVTCVSETCSTATTTTSLGGKLFMFSKLQVRRNTRRSQRAKMSRESDILKVLIFWCVPPLDSVIIKVQKTVTRDSAIVDFINDLLTNVLFQNFLLKTT